MPKPSPSAGHPALRSLGSAVRAARTAQNISQEDLADRAQVDRAYMGGIERGVQNVGLIVLTRVAAALDTSVAELMRAADL